MYMYTYISALSFWLQHVCRYHSCFTTFLIQRVVHTDTYIHTYIHTYIYIHIYVCMYIYTCTHTYTYKHVYSSPKSELRMYICMHTYMHTHTHTHSSPSSERMGMCIWGTPRSDMMPNTTTRRMRWLKYMHTCTHACTHINMNVCDYCHAHAHVYLHTHTHKNWVVKVFVPDGQIFWTHTHTLYKNTHIHTHTANRTMARGRPVVLPAKMPDHCGEATGR